MFYSRKNRTRQSRRQKPQVCVGRMSRRLRAELMESRMMLSATAPNVEVSWPPFQDELISVQLTFNATQVVLTAPDMEGGFVSNGAISLNASTQFEYVDQAPTIEGLLDYDSTIYEVDYNGAVDGVELFDSGGLAPRVIEVTNYQMGPSPAIQPDHDQLTVVPREGGWISIRPLLNPGVANGEVNDGESVVTATPAKSRIPFAREVADSSDDERSLSQISGEWARAAVFEIAGGEPVAETLTMSVPQSKSDSASNGDPDAQTPETSTFGNASREANGSDASKNVTSTDSVGDVPLAAAVGSGAPMPQAQLGVPVYDRALRASSIAHSLAAPADEVLAAAFDEIGEGELAVGSPSSDYLRLNSWLSGTPLLLMFALERVTARRSRARQSGAATPKLRQPRHI